MTKLIRKNLWLFILLSVILVGLVIALRAIPKFLPLREMERKLAMQAVQTNAAWQPVTRRVNGLDMVLVPAGCFQMGATETQLQEALSSCDQYYGVFGCELSFENEGPAHQVCFPEPFWIGKTAVTNWQYGSVFRQSLGTPIQRLTWPTESVSWRQAADFCQERGVRLPTEAEWEYAARGPDALIYPWGNEYDIDKATLRKISPAPVGEKPAGASWVGALDMSGGIGEWVNDWYAAYSFEAQTDPSGPSQGQYRVVRGGDWFAHASFFVRTTYRDPKDPEYTTSSVGFRCAGDY